MTMTGRIKDIELSDRSEKGYYINSLRELLNEVWLKTLNLTTLETRRLPRDLI